jgi:hypothetical protein
MDSVVLLVSLLALAYVGTELWCAANKYIGR